MTQSTIKTMFNQMKHGKIYGIFHNDLDGYGCGKVASTFFNVKEATYNSYGTVNSVLDSFYNGNYKNYNGLIVADVNLDLKKLQKLNSLANNGYPVVYFDHHHKSDEQIEFLKKSKIFSVVNDEFSATKLMFNYFTENQFAPRTNDIDFERYREIVDLIDSWDTFKFQDPETYEIVNEGARDLSIYFKEFGFERTFEKVDNYITCKFDNIFSNMEVSNIRLVKRNLRRTINDRNKNLEVIQFPFEGEVMNVGVTYADKDFSEIGNRLNILNKHLSFIAIVDMVHKTVNFRTIFDSPNLAQIATMYGGGGHPKSAGCVLNEKAFNTFVNKSLDREQINTLLSFSIPATITTEEAQEEQ